jgi:hypothetical protein
MGFMTGQIVPFPTPDKPPELDALVRRVREMALDSANIEWDHPHLRDRMAERTLTMRHALEVLRNGRAISGPTLDDYGDWRIKMTRKVAGRKVQVVVAVTEKNIVVVTVI